jgi:hypothetical protein
MICPYVVHRKSILQITRNYNEDGIETDSQQVEQNRAECMECQKENCGAWHDNECRYYKG